MHEDTPSSMPGSPTSSTPDHKLTDLQCIMIFMLLNVFGDCTTSMIANEIVIKFLGLAFPLTVLLQ